MLESWQQTITGTAGKTRLLKGTASLPAAAVGLLRGTTPSYQPRSSAQLSDPSKKTLQVQFPRHFSGRKGKK